MSPGLSSHETVLSFFAMKPSRLETMCKVTVRALLFTSLPDMPPLSFRIYQTTTQLQTRHHGVILKFAKCATVPGPTHSPIAPAARGCFKSFTTSVGCAEPFTYSLALSPTTTFTFVHSPGTRSRYASYLPGLSL